MTSGKSKQAQDFGRYDWMFGFGAAMTFVAVVLVGAGLAIWGIRCLIVHGL